MYKQLWFCCYLQVKLLLKLPEISSVSCLNFHPFQIQNAG
jgi:hypothetical protein